MTTFIITVVIEPFGLASRTITETRHESVESCMAHLKAFAEGLGVSDRVNPEAWGFKELFEGCCPRACWSNAAKTAIIEIERHS